MHHIQWYELLGGLFIFCMILALARWIILGGFVWACYHAWQSGASTETYVAYGVIAFIAYCIVSNFLDDDDSPLFSSGDDQAQRIQDDYHRRQREDYFR